MTDIVILVIMAALMVLGFIVFLVIVVLAEKLFQEFRPIFDAVGVFYFLMAFIGYVILMLVFQNVFPAIGWT